MELGLRRLRILREVAEHGGVTAAARAMHYSPSGISQQVAALEEVVGAPVLERQGRGVRLTEVGRVLVEHAGILLEAEREARSAVEHARDTLAVELVVGVFCTVAAGLLPGLIRDLAQRHPEVSVITREVDPDEAPHDLRHGHLDLAFMIDYPDAPEPWSSGVTVLSAGLDEMHLAVPSGGPVSGPVDLADLADADWVLPGVGSYYGRALRSACRQAGFEPRVHHQVDEQPTALAMVAAGLGLTMVSDLGRAFLPAGVDVVQLLDPPRRQILVAHDEADSRRPAVRVFLESASRAAVSAGLASTPRRPLR